MKSDESVYFLLLLLTTTTKPLQLLLLLLLLLDIKTLPYLCFRRRLCESADVLAVAR